jgi:hypothetical protein
VGAGDELMGAGIARGAKSRGKRIAFGDGGRIIHHKQATEIFRGNPNIAFPGDEGAKDLEWIAHYQGNRLYYKNAIDRWIWIPGRVGKPGEIFFTDEELRFAEEFGKDFVLIEPSTPRFKAHSVNKQWPVDRYDEVSRQLLKQGYDVVQFEYAPPLGPAHLCHGVRKIQANTFRLAAAVIARAALYVGPEGGLPHAAAAAGVKAVVLYGGFLAPEITGYMFHTGIFTGDKPCGSFHKCQHCIKAMQLISVETVYEAALRNLNPVKEQVA